MADDEPLLSPSRLLRAAKWWLVFELAGLDIGFIEALRTYHREQARVQREGEDYRPAFLIWPGPGPRNIYRLP